MSPTSIITAAAESTTGASSGVNHWVVGIIVLALLLVLMWGLQMFGAGRDHS